MRVLLEILPCSSVVMLGDISAIITAICITGTNVQYKIVWWDGRKRYEEWVNEYEINKNNNKKVNIGFKTTNEKTN